MVFFKFQFLKNGLKFIIWELEIEENHNYLFYQNTITNIIMPPNKKQWRLSKIVKKLYD